MKPFKRPRDGFALHFTSLLLGIHTYRWNDSTDDQLATLLRSCARDGKRTAEAYSIIKEVIRRKTGLTLFDSQLIAAHSMAMGHIAELPTGEGKTLAAVVAAAVFALRGQSVHILVFNDYLASRDYHANRAIFAACGLTCGYIVSASDFAHRKTAYGCNVVYVSAKEAGFDCLRDFLCTEKEKLLLPSLSVALVDEADSILLDEARIPLVLAGNAEVRTSITREISRAVSLLSMHDIGLNRAENQAWLTDSGVRLMEAQLGLDNLFLQEHMDTLAMVNAAIEARFLLQRDKDYVVKDGQVLVVDESTGRVAQSRRFPDLLHQAVEIQELGLHGTTSMIYNSMTMQAYLRQYAVLCGMTGTASSSAYEFWQMYDLQIDVIPPHCPCIRIDHPDEVFLDKQAHEAAILACIQSCFAKGQPVLLGTQSVQESEYFSIQLAMLSIPYNILNAKNDAEEAAIVAEAGRPHQVTISTNMAGRGVDICLGGRDESEASTVRAAGGLFVISTGINRSLRIDNQLRGRAGRQGDPGESRFFVCLQDLTMETFWGIEEYERKHYPRLLRRAQRQQEGKDIEARYMLERYADIMEGQRKRITAYRTRLLLDQSAPEIMQNEAPELLQTLIKHAGIRGVTIAEKQLTLYFINVHWATYLEAMEDMRSGIHLMVIGKKSPLDEYTLFANRAFAEMMADISRDIIEQMQRCPITDDGIDMEKAGFVGATSTWTYMIDESTNQFSRIPQMIKAMSPMVKGTLFSLRSIYAKVKRRLGKAGSGRDRQQ